MNKEAGAKEKQVENKNGSGQLCQADMARGSERKSKAALAVVWQRSHGRKHLTLTSQLALAQVKVGRDPHL